jgi:hypothetical protein
MLEHNWSFYVGHTNGQAVHGSVFVSIAGSDSNLTVNWSSSPVTIGAYAGKVDAGGQLTGTTYDALHPEFTASRYRRPTLCLCPSFSAVTRDTLAKHQEGIPDGNPGEDRVAW